MISLAYIMGFVGVGVGLLVAMFIIGAVDNGIACTDINNTKGAQNCQKVKDNIWVVMGIMPITLFFVLFNLFGGSMRDGQ
jgi:uncharacterized membrane protein